MRLIRLTFSFHKASVIFVKKKDGSLYLYVNFCRFKYITKKNCYPLLLIFNLSDLLQKFIYIPRQIFIMYTIWSTYLKITNRRLLFKLIIDLSVISCSLTNTPTIFQQFMSNIISNLLDVYVIIYLNDIYIYSNDISANMSRRS